MFIGVLIALVVLGFSLFTEAPMWVVWFNAACLLVCVALDAATLIVRRR
jgi:hypothetical protein